jgi:hypothetical protein
MIATPFFIDINFLMNNVIDLIDSIIFQEAKHIIKWHNLIKSNPVFDDILIHIIKILIGLDEIHCNLFFLFLFF